MNIPQLGKSPGSATRRPGAARRMSAGFTLVEVLAVTAILALLAAGAVAAAKLPLRHARLAAFTAQLEMLDTRARLRADGGDVTELRFDPHSGRVELLTGSEASSVVAITCAPGIHIGRVWIQASRVDSTDGAVRFGEAGTSPSYAVEIREGERTAEWLLFFGLSGQSARFSGAKAPSAVQQILSS